MGLAEDFLTEAERSINISEKVCGKLGEYATRNLRYIGRDVDRITRELLDISTPVSDEYNKLNNLYDGLEKEMDMVLPEENAGVVLTETSKIMEYINKIKDITTDLLKDQVGLEKIRAKSKEQVNSMIENYKSLGNTLVCKRGRGEKQTLMERLYSARNSVVGYRNAFLDPENEPLAIIGGIVDFIDKDDSLLRTNRAVDTMGIEYKKKETEIPKAIEPLKKDYEKKKEKIRKIVEEEIAPMDKDVSDMETKKQSREESRPKEQPRGYFSNLFGCFGSHN